MQELMYLLKTLPEHPQSPIYRMAKRKITEIRGNLEGIARQLECREQAEAGNRNPPPGTKDDAPEELLRHAPDAESESGEETAAYAITAAPILAESLKPEPGMLLSLSLNDTFRFSRELFGNDRERMNRVILRASEMDSYDNALTFIYSELTIDEEDETFADFTGLLKRYFV